MWSKDGEDPRNAPAQAEAEAVKLLRGVGDPAREWWIYSVHGLWVGHLRVPVTPEEYKQMPPGCALSDAGEAGPERPRTR